MWAIDSMGVCMGWTQQEEEGAHGVVESCWICIRRRGDPGVCEAGSTQQGEAFAFWSYFQVLGSPFLPTLFFLFFSSLFFLRYSCFLLSLISFSFLLFSLSLSSSFPFSSLFSPYLLLLPPPLPLYPSLPSLSSLSPFLPLLEKYPSLCRLAHSIPAWAG